MDYTLLDKLKEIMQGASSQQTPQQQFMPQPQNTGVGPTLANQPQPQPIAQQMPVQAQGQLPALPNMGQPSGGGGLANALAGMGKSFLGTAAETIPTAIFNAALFGNTPQSQAMTYDSMVKKLEEKKEARERRRQDTVGQWATFLYSMQKYGEPLGIKPEEMEMSLMTGTKTGVPQIDAQLDQAREAMKPIIQRGDLGPGDMLEGMKKRAEYDKAMKPEKPTDYELYQKDPEKYKEFKAAGQKPPTLTHAERDPEGYVKMFGEKAKITAIEREKHRAPKEPKEYGAENYILPNKTNVLSYDRGRTYLGENGGSFKMPVGAVKVPGGATLSEIGIGKAQQNAAKELENMELGINVSPREAALKGTGPYKRMASALEAVAGGLGADIVFGKEGLFPETADAKQYLRTIKQLGKAALMNSAKGAIWEQEKIEELYPHPDKLWTNPRIEARKFEQLRNVMITKKKQNLQAILEAVSAQEVDKLRSANRDIDELLIMIAEPAKKTNLSSEDDKLINKYLPKGNE